MSKERYTLCLQRNGETEHQITSTSFTYLMARADNWISKHSDNTYYIIHTKEDSPNDLHHQITQ